MSWPGAADARANQRLGQVWIICQGKVPLGKAEPGEDEDNEELAGKTQIRHPWR